MRRMTDELLTSVACCNDAFLLCLRLKRVKMNRVFSNEPIVKHYFQTIGYYTHHLTGSRLFFNLMFIESPTFRFTAYSILIFKYIQISLASNNKIISLIIIKILESIRCFLQNFRDVKIFSFNL